MEIFGVDIGGSGVKGAPVDVSTGKLLESRYKIKTPKKLSPTEMADAVAELLNFFNWKGPVGCGFPTRLKGPVVMDNSNLHRGWDGKNVQTVFENRTGLPFSIANDADVAGLAEMKFGIGKNQKGTVIMCTFGTGIGSAMFLDGQLIPSTELGKLNYKKDVFEKYAADSARKREELSYPKWGKRVNEFFHHVEYLFSPDLLIIGGGASKKLDLYKDELTVKTPVVAAQMLNVAGTVGAAMSYKNAQT